jgi:Mrp family chromosome partitioning ATPase
MVTSPLSGDGKTFTSINLALSLARERDLSVLLMDADLLRPKVSRIFGLTQERGLSNALTDDELNAESLVISTNIRGFSVFPAGAPMDSSAELLSSDRMHEILRSLCLHNPRRIVLLDSPPLLITSEARTLLTVTGQVVLVVRAGVTPRQAVIDALGLFDEDQVGGVVLNGAHMTIMQGYYGYGAYGIDGDDISLKP